MIELIGKFRDAFSIGTIPFVAIASLVGAAIFGVLAYTVDRIAIKEKARLGSDIQLTGSPIYVYLRWVPKERVGVRTLKGITRDSGWMEPTFYVKNLGPQPVKNVSVKWTLRAAIPIKAFFEQSSVFAAFQPMIDALGMFTLYEPGSDRRVGSGFQASDTGTSHISFVLATPNSDDRAEIKVDPAVVYGLVLRIIGDNQVVRTVGGNQPPGLYGIADGPTIDVELAYTDAVGTHTRRFQISTVSTRCQDNAGGGLCGDSVAFEHYSDLNFRGMIIMKLAPIE